jgi:hypothetical protein
MRTYKEILSDVSNSCDKVFYTGYKGVESNVVEAAAKIYIAELQLEYYRETNKKSDSSKQGRETFVDQVVNGVCKSESDHEWECCGIGTDGSTFRCKKCGAYKKYPFEYQPLSITMSEELALK